LTWHDWLTVVLRPWYGDFRRVMVWIPEGARVVDVGCGAGSFLRIAMEERGVRSGLGVDRDRRRIMVARRAKPVMGLEFAWREDGGVGVVSTADVVTVIDVVHHVPAVEQGEFLARVMMALRPGARLIVRDIEPTPWWRAWAARVTDWLSTGTRPAFVPGAEVVAWVRASGMRVVHHSVFSVCCWRMYLVVADRPAEAASTMNAPRPASV